MNEAQLLVLVDPLLSMCRSASAAILKVYYAEGAAFGETTKADNSPVTKADLAADHIITRALGALTPGLPVISEEAAYPAFAERRQWTQYWLVDPLDGTKEFLCRNDQFTINIALIEQGRPILGVIFVPVTGEAYVGGVGLGASKYHLNHKQTIHARDLRSQLDHHGVVDVVASVHHLNTMTESLIECVARSLAPVQKKNIGSSLKFCLLADGQADFYPRCAPTSEWDTAAAQALLEAAGGGVYTLDGNPLLYNSKDSVLNPSFYAVADRRFPWQNILSL